MSARPMPMPASAQRPDPSSRLKLLDWRPLRQNALRDFATVRIDPPGTVINDRPVHRKRDALMPGEAQINQTGQVLVDDRGKQEYTPVIEIPSRDVQDRISTAVVILIKTRDPEVLA